jgi:hypothetical protein
MEVCTELYSNMKGNFKQDCGLMATMYCDAKLHRLQCSLACLPSERIRSQLRSKAKLASAHRHAP